MINLATWLRRSFARALPIADVAGSRANTRVTSHFLEV
jgi:hypothetical protein